MENRFVICQGTQRLSDLFSSKLRQKHCQTPYSESRAEIGFQANPNWYRFAIQEFSVTFEAV